MFSSTHFYFRNKNVLFKKKKKQKHFRNNLRNHFQVFVLFQNQHIKPALMQMG